MDAHDAVFAFHQEVVQVSDEERARLARARDRNVDRVLAGLRELRLPVPLRDRSQGGYAMHTLTRRDDGDQDIDVALIFDARQVQVEPSVARQAVLEAILAVSPPFARPPERRTNAVTVWYSGGYHVDFAVYRGTNWNGARGFTLATGGPFRGRQLVHGLQQAGQPALATRRSGR